MADPVSVEGWRKVTRGPQAAIVSIGILVLGGCAANHAAARSQETFLRGRKSVTSGKYAEAIPVLEGYLRDNPRGKYASRAGLFLGKAHLGLGQFEEAKKAFEKTIRDFPTTLEGHKCRYKLAFISLVAGDIEDATKRFDDLANHPNGPLAPEAKVLAAFLQKNRTKFNEPEAEAD